MYLRQPAPDAQRMRVGTAVAGGVLTARLLPSGKRTLAKTTTGGGTAAGEPARTTPDRCGSRGGNFPRATRRVPSHSHRRGAAWPCQGNRTCQAGTCLAACRRRRPSRSSHSGSLRCAPAPARTSHACLSRLACRSAARGRTAPAPDDKGAAGQAPCGAQLPDAVGADQRRSPGLFDDTKSDCGVYASVRNVHRAPSVRPITLTGFDRKFAKDADPWSTFSNRDEAVKRRAILHAIGQGPLGRVLEIAAGNGSNSVAMAPRTLRLDATEATASGTALVKSALQGNSRARALRLVVPGRLPRSRYDVAVVAEVLYYLRERDMARTARDLVAALRPGGVLVLAHHRVDYPDFAQHANRLQQAFLLATQRRWQVRVVRRTRRWLVLSCRLAV
ncbi:hypothetical protein WR25_21416 [Diploscapter pachys]|uniref:Methyltransferase type 12 domain-containing protein n=1 Tax=Diploscapter pachys TaxID=2018661 RepID=A0A2A2K830_9BILA|nr:hypothetical protein WR25_21416 [Diploscapter pachys]